MSNWSNWKNVQLFMRNNFDSVLLLFSECSFTQLGQITPWECTLLCEYCAHLSIGNWLSLCPITVLCPSLALANFSLDNLAHTLPARPSSSAEAHCTHVERILATLHKSKCVFEFESAKETVLDANALCAMYVLLLFRQRPKTTFPFETDSCLQTIRFR